MFLPALALGTVLSALSGGAARAQEDDLAADKAGVRLDIAFEGASAAPFLDPNLEDESFRARTGLFHAGIPLGSIQGSSGSRVLTCRFSTSLAFAASSPDISFLEDQRTLYVGLIQLTSAIITRQMNLVLLSLGSSVAEDEELISHPKLRFSGLAIASQRVHEKVNLIYGGVYSYIYGKGLLLPVLGAEWRASPRWTVVGTLPFTVKVRQQLRPRWALNYRLGVLGQQYGYDNEPGSGGAPAPFPGEPDRILLSIVGGRLSGELEWAPSARLVLVGQLGLHLGRRMIFTDEDGDEILDSEIEPVGFAKVYARVLLGGGS